MTLTLTDGEVSVTVTGPVVDAAKSRPSTEVDARRQLDKLGGTPFALEEESRLQVMVDEGIFLPVSALNALRRDAVERLIRMRTEAFASSGRPSRPDAVPSPRPQPDSPIGPDTLAVIFSDPALAEGLAQAGATLLCFAPRTFTPEALSRDLPRLPRGGVAASAPADDAAHAGRLSGRHSRTCGPSGRRDG